MRSLRSSSTLLILLLTLGIMLTTTGCFMGTETIDVEYLPGFEAERLFYNEQPSIAVNKIWDERPQKDRVGEGYNMYGGKTETWITRQTPTDILEAALIKQLKSMGFVVVMTSGWDLAADSIPEYITSDFVAGGRLKAFWVESRPGLVTVSVNSRVTFDLVIADVETGKVIWAGQFTGSDQPETIIRLDSDMRDSLSRSLTEAVNSAFRDDSVRRAFSNVLQLRF